MSRRPRTTICARPKTGSASPASMRCAPASEDLSIRSPAWRTMAPSPQRLTVTRRAWPLARPLTTAHGVETTADVVVAEISDGEARGRGECVPYPRYGESIDSVVAALEAMKGAVFSGLDRDDIATRDAAGRGPQRARLRVLGPRCEARLSQRRGDGRARRAEAGRHGVYAASTRPSGWPRPRRANRARPLLKLKLAATAISNGCGRCGECGPGAPDRRCERGLDCCASSANWRRCLPNSGSN